MRWKQIGQWWVLMLALLLGGLSGALPSQAAASTPASGFILTPLLPKDQLDKQAGYFNLKVTPGATQVFKVSVSNPGKSAITLQVTPVNATTSDAGNVAYVPSDRHDPSATTTFTDMTTGGVTVKLAAHQAKTVTFKTTIPKAGFKGEVLGGLFATNPTANAARPTTSQGFMLKNRYAEVTAVALWCQPQVTIPVKLALDQVKVTPTNGQPMLFAKLRNLTPTLFGQLNIQARVIQRATGKTITTQQLKSGSMAPNSWFNYQVALGTKNLAAGKYQLKLHLTSGRRVWNFNRDFTLTAQRAEQHNRHLVGPRKINWWLWGTVALMILLALLIAAYWVGQRRSRKE
ncbi:DUF916 and DUF3324 domain-containing protein [Lactiplantibacillus paraplantarum]|uniref:DUF916 and DUF3324 domain-containing protein n=1 Tax=Lactiplantibacillus paraplantarum TaxID=60520 RepID=A0A4V2L1Q2_9LACO|nr:DUF916 and DUF3324 domain-containing protein [Lactiplantibacillus paraplantarum]